MYYIYIVRCQDGSLYTGIAADIARRMREHLSGGAKCAKYTKNHPVCSMEVLFSAENRADASRLEADIKLLTRQQKLQLISGETSLARLLSSKLDPSRYERLPVLDLSTLFERMNP